MSCHTFIVQFACVLMLSGSAIHAEAPSPETFGLTTLTPPVLNTAPETWSKGEQEILFAKITEADIKAGQPVSEGSRLRQLINRLADHGGGVLETREPQFMEQADEAAKGGKPKKN